MQLLPSNSRAKFVLTLAAAIAAGVPTPLTFGAEIFSTFPAELNPISEDRLYYVAKKSGLHTFNLSVEMLYTPALEVTIASVDTGENHTIQSQLGQGVELRDDIQQLQAGGSRSMKLLEGQRVQVVVTHRRTDDDSTLTPSVLSNFLEVQVD